MIAVVGSRMCTDYGKRMARQLVEPLAQAGLTIVSGLAFGIDAIAHESAIDVGGRTIAVLGSGADRVTPVDHILLGDRILNHGGTIMSQFPEGSFARKHHFPIRNLTISGMCLGTLVIEATQASGSLLTAAAARNQGRQIFSVPGPIDAESSKGTNHLIQEGAHLVTSANDILDILNLSGAALERDPVGPVKADTKEEALILPTLGRQPKHMDVIIRESTLSAKVVGTSLTLMEIKGKVRHVGGNYYIIC